MTSLIRPTYSLLLGSQRFTEQAIEIVATLDVAPVVDALVAIFPAAVPLSAAVGDPAHLTLGNGESEKDIFTGTIEAIHRGFDHVRVRALNASGTLARVRPAATYEKTSAGEVARKLCGEAGVDAGDIDDGVDLAFYAADPSRSAYEHVARVAGWSGAIGCVSADGALDMRVLDAGAADLGLRYGRELVAIDQQARPVAIEAFVVAGESGAGSTSVPEALRPTSDFFGGNRPDGPSATSRWSSSAALRTAAAAASAGAALRRSYGASRLCGSFEAFLLPQLRPGVVVDLQDLPDGFANDLVWLRRVRHAIGPRGGVTRADFARGGDSFNPLALLGSALGF